LIAPVAVDLLSSGMTAPFRYFAADAFYYFTVGRNFAESGVPTFDQTLPTNGFHPLWQLWVTLLFKITLALSLPETTFFYLALVSGVLFIAAGILLVGLAIIRVRGELPRLFAFVPVGIYSLLMLPLWLAAQYGFGLRNPD